MVKKMGDGLYLQIPVAEYDELMKCKEFMDSIVRCKDCKYGLTGLDVWCDLYDCTKELNGFCDMGKRKDGDSDANN